MKLILGALSKVVYRYGILMAIFVVLGIALLVVPLVPKFRTAIWLLPHFVPGIWAFWLQSFVINSLFGIRAYRKVALVHVYSIMVYMSLVFTLPFFFGLPGVTWAFNAFCFSMCWFGFRAARQAGLYGSGYVVYSAFSAEERLLLGRAFQFFGKRLPREGT